MNFLKLTFSWILIWTGFALIGLGGLNLITHHQDSLLQKLRESVQTVRAQTISLGKKQVQNRIPYQIEFPSLNHQVFILPNQIIDGQWQVAQTRANYLIGSGVIGEPGNVVVYAHRRPELFGNLSQLQNGDQIIVRSSDITAQYQVVGSSVVPADQVNILADTPEKLLTLYTCNGWVDEDRLVVRAKFVREI